MSDPPAKTYFEPRPLKLGSEWCVVATYPDGGKEKILGFKSEAEALAWIGSDASLKWVKARGY